MLDENEIVKFAEKAEKNGETGLAVILYTYLGARALGNEGILAILAAQLAKQWIADIDYSKWIRGG